MDNNRNQTLQTVVALVSALLLSATCIGVAVAPARAAPVVHHLGS